MSSSPLTRILEVALRPAPAVNHAPLAATGRAGRNLPAAVTTAVVLVAVLGLSLALQPGLFAALAAVLCLLAVWELAAALARIGAHLVMAPLYVGTLGILASAWLLGPEAALVAAHLAVVAIVLFRLLDPSTTSALRDVLTSVFALVYVPFLATFLLLVLRSHGACAVLLCVALTSANDLGGWGAGILFGRHPMAPRLSPKKSWEGFAGSVLACAAVGIGGMWALGAAWWWGPLIGLGAAVVGTLGDLTESLIKREVGLKDMSRLLPGHGGVLDRVDALLMASPLFYLVLDLALGGVTA